MTDRKKEHIDLTFKSQLDAAVNDNRFYYEPLLSKHPVSVKKEFDFLGKKMHAPLWVSSMTGGTKESGVINKRLASVCREFGLGMGLGSCRKLLDNREYWSDFDVRDEMGDQPLYANLGISQLEELVRSKSVDKINSLISELRADGLIIHVNPLQEWFQAEGDRLSDSPIDIISELLEKTELSLIVKEVGQGMGPESLRQLLKLPLEAVEFAAFGGTNFSRVETLREKVGVQSQEPLVFVGHTASEMVGFVNKIILEESSINCKQIIISGGVKNFLDGYYLMETCQLPAIYGHGANFLKYAVEGSENLRQFVENQILGFRMAEVFLKVK